MSESENGAAPTATIEVGAQAEVIPAEQVAAEQADKEEPQWRS
jgi:hypothetical protein